ncbi:hypothetical protein [Azospirillum rugosum]|uniref:DNA-directed RNA polymerase subunit RPC12/RpoP n=1 Tax=Azospirillum rugosum TaxID=416170 RepID=A0ABS4SIA4_9PROT|nr:hypothetical protein [Azospirillum rugosum]MBP2292227.1 DNA-directed RNA polymerase subunit RPC12/RpoP [Azospirillum rugosum]MDQ0525986.1 DNA-directed RNA polymerase subunit RPC12/RpoP [Azospirillum rugosum]
MLYLRDIEVDVDVRCRACGHEGVLPRAAMLRRFGPNYPVLSIAPHYRCSRCDSRDTESRPAPPPMTFAPAAEVEEAPPSFAGPLAALQGLLDAVRSRGDEDEEEHQAPPPAAPEPAIIARPLPSLELEDLIADTTPPEVTGRRPLWEPVSLADMAADLREEDPEEAEPAIHEDEDQGDEDEDEDAAADLPRPFAIADARPERAAPEDDDDPVAHFNRTIAALRGMLGDDDAPRDTARPKEAPHPAAADREDAPEDDEPPRAVPGPLLARSDFEDEDEPSEDETAEDEPSDEDIVAFAIRDPEKAPPRRERVAVPEEQPLDKTIAALRNMVHEAAADPDDEPEDDEDDDAPEDLPDDLTAGWLTERDADEPASPLPHRQPLFVAADDDEEDDQEEEPPAPRKSAQEMDMEEALRALRALVEQEDDDEDDPLPPLPPTPIPLRAGRPTMAELMEQATRDDEDAAEMEDDPADRKPAALFPTPIPLGVAPDEDDDEPLDLVDMVEHRQPAPEPKGAPKGGDKKGGDTGESSSLDKTIAALRSMLELDGKRGR